MSKQEAKLRRARRTLRNIRSYCRFQVAMAKAGAITPGLTWRDVSAQVNGILAGWCDKALKESVVGRRTA